MADNLGDKEEKLSSMSDAVKEVIDDYPIGHEFFGNELKDDVVRIYPGAMNMYPDTILKMARRHRRDSYISIDRNNSLYMRVKSNLEIAQEKIERERAEELAREERLEQPIKTEQLSLPFAQGFFGVFFFFAFGFLFNGESTFGCPLTERFFNISISTSDNSNIALTPIYRTGSYPARFSLLRVASVETGAFEVLIFWAISKTVSNIYSLYRQNTYKNQVKNSKMSDIWTYMLFICIVKNRKFSETSENSFQNLDNAIGHWYSFIMSICPTFRHIEKTAPGKPDAERAHRAKGDFYERLQEFSGMA